MQNKNIEYLGFPLNTSTHLRIFDAPKCGIVTKEKVATRFVSKFIYDKPDYKSMFDNDLQLFHDNTFFTKNDDIKNLFDIKQNKKEVLVLYRNPVNRLITGIIQDHIISLAGDVSQLYLLNDDSSYTNDFISDFSKALYTNTVDMKYYDILLLIINKLIKYIQYNGITHTVHTENYLPMMSDFVLNNIDNVKIHFINIDNKNNKLIELLVYYSGKLATNYNTEGTTSSSFISNMFKNLIKNNEIINNMFKTYLSSELYYYNKFEKSELNVLNIKI